DGGLTFSFQAGGGAAGIDDTIGGVLGLPGGLAPRRERRGGAVFAEFPGGVAGGPHPPHPVRAGFRGPPGGAGGEPGRQQNLVGRICSDRNEPFWRSAKRIELGPIPVAAFAAFLRLRYDGTDRGLTDEAVDRLLAVTGGHPYATQELAYFTWELVPEG